MASKGGNKTNSTYDSQAFQSPHPDDIDEGKSKGKGHGTKVSKGTGGKAASHVEKYAVATTTTLSTVPPPHKNP